MEFTSSIPIGVMAKEQHTGIEGRVTAVSFHETGCTQICIRRLGVDKDGKPYEALWFEEPLVTIVEETTQPLRQIAGGKPGAPYDERAPVR